MSFLGRTSPTSVFPTYLLPSVPFRRRKSSSDSTTSSDSDHSIQSPEATTHRPSDPYLQGHKSHLRCARCATDLCFTSQIISKGFTGRHGRAYLVSASPVASGMSPTTTAMNTPSLPNTHTLKAVPRQLVTGAHTVSDVSCAFCGQVLGWKYVAAEEESQRYKVGKFILETKKIYSSSCWEYEAADQSGGGGGGGGGGVEIPPSRAQHRGLARVKEEAVEFDSQDEDECEDLFAGVWSPTLAAKRRQGRRFGRDVAEVVKNDGGR